MFDQSTDLPAGYRITDWLNDGYDMAIFVFPSFPSDDKTNDPGITATAGTTAGGVEMGVAGQIKHLPTLEGYPDLRI
ncbi:MAG: hypothetical protein RBR67_17020 [Desulfobacterium sp.]|nr:hypothetical protein [Desulfobacterium sp.]